MRYPFSPEILDAMPEEIAELYRDLELALLTGICSRLKASGELNEVTVQHIRVLRSHGIDLDDIKDEIREQSGIGEKKLSDLFKDVIRRNEEYYWDLVDLAEITKPESLVDRADIDAIVRQTRGEMKNITRSMGFLVDNGRTMLPPAKAYQWALDRAAIRVKSGAISYNEAIKSAVKELSDSGLKTVDFESGSIDQVDVAARRAVMTGVSQVCDKYVDQSASFLNTPYVEVSAHAGARDKPYPNLWSSHKLWQGKVYYQSKHGEKDPLGKYPDLVKKTGYGFVDGLCGANCRHRRHPFIPGVMEPTYTEEQLANIDPPPFEYEGKTYSHYEATQKQRQIERTVRKLKREQAAFEAAGLKDDATAVGGKIRILRSKYKEFSKAASLRMQAERMKVYINS